MGGVMNPTELHALNWWLWTFQSGPNCYFGSEPGRGKAMIEEFRCAGVR